MSKLRSRIGLSAFLFGICIVNAGQASAAIFSESFDYNLGALGSQGGWTSNANATVVDPTPDMMANGTNGGDRALRLTANSNDMATHAFASQSGDVFFSFLFRFDTGALSDNDFLSLWIDNGTTISPDHSDVPNIGLKVNQGATPGTRDYFVRLENGGEAYSFTLGDVGTTVQIVGRLYKSSSTNYNKFDLWVNPGVMDLGTPDATATLIPPPTGQSAVSRLGIRTANLDGGDVWLIDEIRVASSFQEVVLPEPVSFAIWGGLSLVGLGCYRRRRPKRA